MNPRHRIIIALLRYERKRAGILRIVEIGVEIERRILCL